MTKEKAAIDSLLATYNGSRFLTEQLDSILRQTTGNWRLLVRDDGSTDGTREILLQYDGRLPEAVRDVVSRFASLSKQGFVKRRVIVARYRFMAKRLLPGLMYFIFI